MNNSQQVSKIREFLIRFWVNWQSSWRARSRWGKAIVSENDDVLRNMLIQFHATLAASCNLRDIKDINGIAFFAYFDGTFSQQGIQFLFPVFEYNLCFEILNLLHCSFHVQRFVVKTHKIVLFILNKRIASLKTTVSNKNSIIIRFVWVESCSRASHSQVSPSRDVPKQKPIISGEIIRLGRHN